MTPTYKLEELAAEAGVSPRTVRYYVQRGLLPAPELRGKDTSYGRGHILRLQAIKRLQQAPMALDEIQIRIAGATEAEIARIARGEAEIARPSASEPHASDGHKKGVEPQRAPTPPGIPLTPLAPPADSMPGEPVATLHVYRLAPGVELMVRAGLPAPSRALVREILDRYATSIEKDADQCR